MKKVFYANDSTGKPHFTLCGTDDDPAECKKTVATSAGVGEEAVKDDGVWAPTRKPAGTASGFTPSSSAGRDTPRTLGTGRSKVNEMAANSKGVTDEVAAHFEALRRAPKFGHGSGALPKP